MEKRNGGKYGNGKKYGHAGLRPLLQKSVFSQAAVSSREPLVRI